MYMKRGQFIDVLHTLNTGCELCHFGEGGVDMFVEVMVKTAAKLLSVGKLCY